MKKDQIKEKEKAAKSPNYVKHHNTAFLFTTLIFNILWCIYIIS